MTEDKQAILNALLPALQLTRAGKDVVIMLSYCKDTEAVIIMYHSGTDEVNVALDSGAAMISDVAKAVTFG